MGFRFGVRVIVLAELLLSYPAARKVSSTICVKVPQTVELVVE